MRTWRCISGLACAGLFLFAVSSTPRRVEAVQTCDLTLGDGTPPLEVDVAAPGICGFLRFSWRAFLAMNWPALETDPAVTTILARGLPDRTKVIGQNGDNETVWEQYQPNWYLFMQNNPPPKASGGQSFAAWNQNANLPSACGPPIAAAAKAKTGAPKILSSLSKFDPMPGVGQAFSKPLIDQRGFYARYEIRLSYEVFNYINANQFYLVSAQAGQSISLPAQQGQTPGAILLKAAWKTLSAEEINSNRFHRADAFMFTPGQPGLDATCVGPVPIGLVGLHVVQKTALFPRQIWATFEHVDNVPDDPMNAAGQRWSFFDPASNKVRNVGPDCPTAVLPCDWQPTSSHTTDKTGGPTQVVRENPISQSPNQPALNEINAAARAALIKVNPKSVWQFYRLVESQWQVPGGFFPSTPVANITMETYHQSPAPNASCMDCHKRATAADNMSDADFTFELKLAWKPTIIPPPPVHP